MELRAATMHSADVEPPVHGCANCGVPAPDTYCPACGQSTRERLPTFRQFMRDATGRYIAYDGRFWKTLGALLLRPGFLTKEYLAGRRRRYIGPARLFLVSSLLLFATLKFAADAIDMDDPIQFDAPKEPRARAGKGDPAKAPEVPAIPRPPDPPGTVAKSAKADRFEKRDNDDQGDFLMLDDDLNLNLSELAVGFGILAKPIERFNALPRAQKIEQLKAGTLRYGPYAMFALLPAIALLLKMLYLGRRRRYPARPRLYGEHLVFAAHNHAFLFVVGSLITTLGKGWIVGILATWMFVYLMWATRVVYGGGFLGIAARAMVLGLSYLILFGFVTIGLIVAAVLLR